VSSLTRVWREWFEVRESPVPREAQLNRIQVKNLDGLVSLLKALNGKDDCYVSVYSIPQRYLKEVDVIFIETDDLNAAEKIDKALNENHVNYIKVFSGNKGYHYYIPIYPIRVRNFKRAVANLLQELGIDDVVDPHVVGDIARMARVPYTVHTETGLYAVIVNGNNGKNIPRDAIKPNKIPKIGWKPSKLATLLVLGYDREESTKIVSGSHDIPFEAEYYPECILHLIEKAKATRYLNHQERLHLGAYLLKYHSIDEVVKVFSVLEDFNEKVTRYHLEKMGKDFKCFSCLNAKRLGICPLRNPRLCLLYPSINMWL